MQMPESGIAGSIFVLPREDGRRESKGRPPALTPGRLVELVRNGEQDAFEELYQRYASFVHGVLLARVPRSEVDDLVQEVFITAFRSLDTLRDGNAFPAWIASIARRQAADYFRRSRPTEELPQDVEAAPRPLAEAREVLSAIRNLPEAYNETLMLRLVEGMTGPEIAEATGMTPDSVRVNLHRGMKMLRKRLRIGK